MTTMAGDPKLALERWIAALNARGEPEVARAAVDPGVRIDRCSWSGPERGGVVETYEGFEATQRWLWRNPHGVVFSAASDLDEVGGEHVVRYRVAYQDFANYGHWRFTVTDDSRIRGLVHVPDDLPEVWKTGIPEGAMFLPTPDPRATVAGPHECDHSHDHDAGDDPDA